MEVRISTAGLHFRHSFTPRKHHPHSSMRKIISFLFGERERSVPIHISLKSKRPIQPHVDTSLYTCKCARLQIAFPGRCELGHCLDQLKPPKNFPSFLFSLVTGSHPCRYSLDEVVKLLLYIRHVQHDDDSNVKIVSINVSARPFSILTC